MMIEKYFKFYFQQFSTSNPLSEFKFISLLYNKSSKFTFKQEGSIMGQNWSDSKWEDKLSCDDIGSPSSYSNEFEAFKN